MRVEALDLNDSAVATALLAVQRAAYAIEADLIGSRAIPQLHETLEQLTGAPLQWIGISEEGELVAALAYTEDGDLIDIDRLVVAPMAMRRGFGSALVASLGTAPVITVSTGALNRPAHELYLGLGFSIVGESEPVPGLSVTHFERRPHES